VRQKRLVVQAINEVIDGLPESRVIGGKQAINLDAARCSTQGHGAGAGTSASGVRLRDLRGRRRDG
jgi:hypothetical protein